MVDDALALLNQPEQLFSFGGADCQPTETMMENNLAESHDDEHHGDEHHDEDEHDDEHDDEHHDDADKSHDDEHDDEHHDDDGEKSHDDEHHDDHDDEDGEKSHDDDHHDDHDGEHSDDEETHSSVLVSYSFDCSNYEQLDTISVEIMKIWSGFEELDVQMIGPGGQAALEITAEQSRIDVKSIR